MRSVSATAPAQLRDRMVSKYTVQLFDGRVDYEMLRSKPWSTSWSAITTVPGSGRAMHQTYQADTSMAEKRIHTQTLPIDTQTRLRKNEEPSALRPPPNGRQAALGMQYCTHSPGRAFLVKIDVLLCRRSLLGGVRCVCGGGGGDVWFGDCTTSLLTLLLEGSSTDQPAVTSKCCGELTA